MTPPVEYIRIEADILRRQDLSCSEKLVLGLVKSFNGTGLRVSNSEIAGLLTIRPDSVSKIFSSLQSKKLITIFYPQSSQRRVYFGEKSKVENNSLREKPQSQDVSTLEKNPTTLDFHPTTLDKTPNITKITKITKKREGRTQPKFIKPTAVQVTEYAQSIGYTIDGQNFVDYYTSNGWKVGRNPMKDWRAAVRTWQRRENKNPQKKVLPRVTVEVPNDGKYQTIKV